MNRNGRQIALSMVAIVLGAGYLMKVIPPETDIGVNDSHSISIDGALVTNPLDIGEAPHGFPPSVLSLYPNPRGEETPATDPASKNDETPSISGRLDPAPPFPFVSNGGSDLHAAMPGEASEPATDFPSDFNLPPSFPAVGEVAVNSSAPGNGGSSGPSGGSPSPGSPPPAQNPGNNPGDVPVVVPPPAPEVEGPDAPPNIDLPSDPQSPGSKGPDIDHPGLPDIIPDSWNPPELPAGTDVPNHQVPDSGMVATMLGFSLALLAALKRRLDLRA